MSREKVRRSVNTLNHLRISRSTLVTLFVF